MRWPSRFIVLLLSLILTSCATVVSGQEIPLGRIQLPPGFRISVFASKVPGARSMTLSPGGVLYVGSRREGNVYALKDADGDGKADWVKVLARDLFWPKGLAFRDGSLYVAEISRLLRYDGIETRLDQAPAPVVVNDRFPKDTHHGWKFIRFGPDGRLYVPVGAPCNICEPAAPYASILRLSPTGEEWEVFARGVRNTVGFDWHPETKELWFTDNGRDWLGDNAPPDELNHAPRKGMHFGFPYCHGKGISDPDFDRTGDACKRYTPPARELGPHVASLGMRFYKGRMFPPKYRNQIFIAEHGSWNRSDPIGYRVTLVRLEGERAVSYEVFAQGWLHNGRAWGRPVDIQELPDGSLLVSDDRLGAIYRITYQK